MNEARGVLALAAMCSLRESALKKAGTPVTRIKKKGKKQKRNAACCCGSGKKSKNCCVYFPDGMGSI